MLFTDVYRFGVLVFFGVELGAAEAGEAGEATGAAGAATWGAAEAAATAAGRAAEAAGGWSAGTARAATWGATGPAGRSAGESAGRATWATWAAGATWTTGTGEALRESAFGGFRKTRESAFGRFRKTGESALGESTRPTRRSTDTTWAFGHTGLSLFFLLIILFIVIEVGSICHHSSPPSAKEAIWLSPTAWAPWATSANWVEAISKYGGQLSSNSSWVPLPTMRPSSMT